MMHRIMVKEYFENWQNRMKRHSGEDNIMKDLWKIRCEEGW
jgi:hypothetical protein